METYHGRDRILLPLLWGQQGEAVFDDYGRRYTFADARALPPVDSMWGPCIKRGDLSKWSCFAQVEIMDRGIE